MEHKISIDNTDDSVDLVNLICSCGWSSESIDQKFMSAVSDRHLNLVSEKGNKK
jgi:hypothetical protein